MQIAVHKLMSELVIAFIAAVILAFSLVCIKCQLICQHQSIRQHNEPPMVARREQREQPLPLSPRGVAQLTEKAFQRLSPGAGAGPLQVVSRW